MAPPMQVCCLPRSLWSTSSQGLLPRASAAAAAAAVLTAHQVLPHHGVPPVQSPPPVGPSEGQDPASTPHSSLSRGKEVDAQNLPHLMDPMSNTRCCEFGHTHLSRLHSCPAVLGGQREAGGAGQGSVVQSGIVLEKWVGSGQPASWDSQATSHPGHSVLTICKPTQGWRPSISFLL